MILYLPTSGETDDAALLEEASRKRHLSTAEDSDDDNDDHPSMTKKERHQLVDCLRRFSQEQGFPEDHVVNRSLPHIEALSMKLNVQEATQSR